MKATQELSTVCLRYAGRVEAARKGRYKSGLGKRGFSLVEMLTAMAVAGILITGLVNGHIQAVNQAEWSAYSLAANALALQQIEKVKSAKWDPRGFPPIDQVVAANFPNQTEILDIPICKTNIVYATNVTTISTISTVPPLKMIRVDCMWPFTKRGPFTNTIVTYRAPDQ